MDGCFEVYKVCGQMWAWIRHVLKNGGMKVSQQRTDTQATQNPKRPQTTMPSRPAARTHMHEDKHERTRACTYAQTRVHAYTHAQVAWRDRSSRQPSKSPRESPQPVAPSMRVCVRATMCESVRSCILTVHPCAAWLRLHAHAYMSACTQTKAVATQVILPHESELELANLQATNPQTATQPRERHAHAHALM